MSKTECPHCQGINDVAPSHIGQYVTCQSCRCKYYVYVPPLENESSAKPRLTEPATRSIASDDVHGENRVMMRQEALLAEIHDDLIDLRGRITIACFLVVAAASAVITVLLLR